MKDDETIKDLMELECYSGLRQKYTVAIHNALYLLNRQKAQIERLEKELTEYKLRLKMSGCTVGKIKSEAIKEFAEILKKRLCLNLGEHISVVTRDDIDKFVKEMTEEMK